MPKNAINRKLNIRIVCLVFDEFSLILFSFFPLNFGEKNHIVYVFDIFHNKFSTQIKMLVWVKRHRKSSHCFSFIVSLSSHCSRCNANWLCNAMWNQIIRAFPFKYILFCVFVRFAKLKSSFERYLIHPYMKHCHEIGVLKHVSFDFFSLFSCLLSLYFTLYCIICAIPLQMIAERIGRQARMLLNTLVICAAFWLIFAIMGVQMFAGKFYHVSFLIFIVTSEMSPFFDIELWRITPAYKYTHNTHWLPPAFRWSMVDGRCSFHPHHPIRIKDTQSSGHCQAKSSPRCWSNQIKPEQNKKVETKTIDTKSSA